MNPSNNEVLKGLLESLTPPPPPRITRPRRRPAPAVPTLRFSGNEFWVASLSSSAGACRGISHDKAEAITRCKMLFSNRSSGGLVADIRHTKD
jgi:hypothetical protein